MLKSVLKSSLKAMVTSLASRFGPHRRTAGEPQLWVLMYHRILPETDERYHQEEPGMRVTPESFSMHLQQLKRHFDLVSLRDWVEAKEEGRTLPDKACAITFDDGWRDNYEYAFPLLKQYQVPATLFAVVDKIGTDFQFWPNIVAALLLHGAGPRLAESTVLEPAGSTNARPDANEIAACIKRLKSRTDAEIFAALESLDWRSLLPGPMPPALMDWNQLGEMQQSGLVNIGSHTCTHRRLTRALGSDVLAREIVLSRSELEARTGRPAELFCFPNGDYNSEALALVHSTYKAAVTTRKGINRARTASLHELTRIGIHNDVSNTPTKFNARLSGWM